MRFIFFLYVVNFFFSPVYDYVDKIFDIKLFFIDKFLAILLITALFLHVAISKKLFLSRLECFIAIMCLFAILPNLITLNLDASVVFSHFYQIFMPFIAISFGSSNLYKFGKFDSDLISLARVFVPFLIILTFGYYFLHNFTSMWAYFGYSSGLIFAVVLSSPKMIKKGQLFFFIILDYFSGKRSSVLMWIILVTLTTWKRALFVFIISVFIGVFLFEQLPDRYQNSLVFDFLDPVSLAIATGGRSSEWTSVMTYLSHHQFWWLHGTGFGNSYLLTDDLTGYVEKRHYVHNQPLLQTYTVGLVVTLIFQVYILYQTIRFLIFSENKSKVGFFVLFYILSFLSASLLVEILPWIIFGYLRRNLKKDEKYVQHISQFTKASVV